MSNILAASGLTLSFLGPQPAFSATVTETNQSFDQVLGDHAPYQQFFRSLKVAISMGDKKTVAVLVKYPLRTRVAGKTVIIKNAQEFVTKYDSLITKNIITAVSKQEYTSLVPSWQGVSVGDGSLWFNGTTGSSKQSYVRITALNP